MGAKAKFYQGEAFSHDGAEVTATYDNGDPKDVSNAATFSSPDMSMAGEKTVTVSYTEGNETKIATYTINVYALSSISSISLSGTYLTNFTKGSEFSSTGIKVTAYYGGEDGATRDVTSSATFTGYDMDMVGNQTVTVSYTEGEVTETATYDITVLLSNPITVTGTVTGHESVEGNVFTINCEAGDDELTLEATATNGTVTFTVDADNTDIDADDYIFENGTLLVDDKINYSGVIIIKATTPATDTYVAGEATITVNVLRVKDDAVIVDFEPEVAYGDTYTVGTPAPDVFDTDGEITLTSTNTAIATVDGMVITAVAVGTVEIAVESAETENYREGIGTITLTVTAPAGKTTAKPAGSVLFNETFDLCDGTGGNDGNLSGSGVGTGSLIDPNKLDEEWALTATNTGAYKCIKLGTSNNVQSITTGSISLTGNGTLTFSAAGWDDNETNTVSVSAAGAALSGDTEITLENGVWNDYAVNITPQDITTNPSGEVFITFSMKRGFLDEVKVESVGSSEETATLNASGYATFCSEYPLDLDNMENGTAWKITDVEETGDVVFEQVTGTVKGGTPLFLMGEASATVTIPSVASTETLADNLLIGTLAPTYVTEGFGLSGDTFKSIDPAGVVPAKKAYLPASVADKLASSTKLRFVFDGNATAITAIEAAEAVNNGVIYNLSGQRVVKPLKGIYIQNGKKFIVK